MPEPTVSVIIPTYNRESLLREAVGSVLAQTFRDYELIVVDDGSTDNTLAYLRNLTDPRVRVIAHERRGNGAMMRNAGLAVARGHWIAFQDSDDVWFPEKLATQLGVLESRPHCRWSYTEITRIDERGRPHPGLPQAALRDGWILESLVRRTCGITLPSVVAERSLLDERGGFDESFVKCHDFELWTRLAASSEVVTVPQPLAGIRSHSGNQTQPSVEVFRYLERIFRTLDDRHGSDLALRRACRDAIAWSILSQAEMYRSQQRYGRAFSSLAAAAAMRPASGSLWKGVAKTVLHPLVPRRLRHWYYRTFKQ